MSEIATFARGAAECLERIRKEERAGIMGEPALEITAKVLATQEQGNDDRKVTRLFIRYDDLIALIKEQNGAGE